MSMILFNPAGSAPDALRLYNAVTTRFGQTEQTVAPHCECGEPLNDEAERELGICFDCQAEAAQCQADVEALPFHPIFAPNFDGLISLQAQKGMSA